MGNCVRPPSSTPTPTPNATPHPFSPATHSPLTQTTPQVCEIQMEPFITYIDGLLSANKKKNSPDQQGSSATTEASEFVKNHIDFAANTMDNISEESKKFNQDFASKLPQEARRVVTNAMEGLGHLHWIGVAFSMAAFVLERIDQVSSNIEESTDLLEKIIKLAKTLQKLNHIMSMETQTLKDAVHTIVDGAIICCSHIQEKTFFRYVTAETVESSLQNTRTKMDSLISDLTLMVTRDTLIVTKDIQEILPRPQQQSQNILQIDPVGIEDHAAAVKNLLDLDGAARAVVIYGFGGIGKTTLAEYVVSKFLSLGDLKLSVIRIDDKNLQITKLQEQIIFDVGGKRIDLKDPIAGQLELGDVLKNQPCFLLIDNVVDKKHVQDILPKKLSFPSRSRILITSRENNMRQVLDLECKEYSVECLPPETARKLLHQIILDGHTYKTNEKEKIDAVADACGGVPLLLEVYGKHLRVDRTESAYEEALDSLRKGERGAYKEEDLSAKLLFVYHKMRDEDTKDAFLDICCFFHEWQKDEVSAIVGERELVALKRGALLKINEKNQVIVHDVIKVMGVGEAKQTRLQSLQDLKMALEENKNLNKIKGIWLPDNEVLFHLESKHLDAMCDSLRVLSIGDWIKPEGQCEKKFKNLRYLHVGDVDAFPFSKASKIENLTVLYSKSVGAMDFRQLPNSLKGLRLISMRDDTTEGLSIN